jgi:hypothetical protein
VDKYVSIFFNAMIVVVNINIFEVFDVVAVLLQKFLSNRERVVGDHLYNKSTVLSKSHSTHPLFGTLNIAIHATHKLAARENGRSYDGQGGCGEAEAQVVAGEFFARP